MTDEKKEIKILNPGDIRREVNKLIEEVCSLEPLATDDPPRGHCEVWVDFSQSDVSTDEKIIQAPDLANLITKAPTGLFKLILDDVNILGDFSLVLDAISTCKTLRIFWCSARIRPETPDIIALGGTLANRSSPWLLNLSLDFRGHPHAAWEVVSPILRAKKLVRLSLNEYNPPTLGDGFLASLDALATLTQLRILQFGVAVFQAPEMDVVTQLVKKMTWLQKLGIFVEKDTSTAALAMALRKHKSMRGLTIHFAGRRKPKELQAFLDTVQDYNFTLEEVELQTTRPHLEGNDNFQELLDRIKFYLTLNKLGRAKLLAPGDTVLASTEEWMKPIADQDDASVIYYFLSKNPAFYLPDPANCSLKPEQGRKSCPQAESSQEETSDKASNAPPKLQEVGSTPESGDDPTEETRPKKKPRTEIEEDLTVKAPPSKKY